VDPFAGLVCKLEEGPAVIERAGHRMSIRIRLGELQDRQLPPTLGAARCRGQGIGGPEAVHLQPVGQLVELGRILVCKDIDPVVVHGEKPPLGEVLVFECGGDVPGWSLGLEAKDGVAVGDKGGARLFHPPEGAAYRAALDLRMLDDFGERSRGGPEKRDRSEDDAYGCSATVSWSRHFPSYVSIFGVEAASFIHEARRRAALNRGSGSGPYACAAGHSIAASCAPESGGPCACAAAN